MLIHLDLHSVKQSGTTVFKPFLNSFFPKNKYVIPDFLQFLPQMKLHFHRLKAHPELVAYCLVHLDMLNVKFQLMMMMMIYDNILRVFQV